MPDNKPHITIDGFSSTESFQSKRPGRNPVTPPQNRDTHGQALLNQYDVALNQYEQRIEQIAHPITEETGIYLRIESQPNCQLPLENLDTKRDYKLSSLQQIGDKEVAIVFIPETKRESFKRKVEAYLNPDKDTTSKTSGTQPRNRKLIDSISSIRLANIESFWTDSPELFPQDTDQQFWWELWLKKRSQDDNPIEIAHEFATRINATVGNTSLTFFNSAVILINASITQLEHATELVSNLAELRKAKEAPNVILDMNPKEQQQWATDLQNRTIHDSESNTSITILDTGINFNHPLISIACNDNKATAWHPDWPKYDVFNPQNPFDPYNDHGSLQAGLAMYGNLLDALQSTDSIIINYQIESARIIPPTGNNNPELYGDITKNTARKLEIDRPDYNRIYSLAITAADADITGIGGQPTSWSSEIDYFSSGFEDDQQRLFVIASGNNRNLNPASEYWNQVHLSEIEDPAQSWNAITVGAYTEFTTNDDETFDGWAPWALFGDVSPASRSSVNWGWGKQAPFKPDVVAEGGNRLITEQKTEVTTAETVSLLTTSGRTEGQLFDIHYDSSASTALVSRHAAILTAEYPHYWPETIRGLIVHSAQWTDRMFERKGLLEKEHSPKVANEVMLKTFGYGVPNLARAKYSANNALTLIAQDDFIPFIKAENATESTDPKLNEMALYELPWPTEILKQLGETEVYLKVTLSYFIEPNPGRRGYRQRYSYQSHGLRFDIIRPRQSLENFRAYINKLAVNEEYDGPEGDSGGWRFGPQLRTRGSLHSDIWTGTAADLSDMNTIAVYPVSGWWKYRTGLDRWRNNVRYSLIVSIDVPDEEVDIYSAVENIIETTVAVET